MPKKVEKDKMGMIIREEDAQEKMEVEITEVKDPGDTDSPVLIYYNWCKKCGICARNCPVKCIPGDRNSGYLIETDRCIRCGTCFEKCPFGAIEKK